MSFRNTVKVSKLQSKNKMVGNTFNPGGFTIETLEDRDRIYADYFLGLSPSKKKKEFASIKALVKVCDQNGWSYPYQYFVLMDLGVIHLRRNKK